VHEQNLKRWEVRPVPQKPVFYVPPHLECVRQPTDAPIFCHLISAPAAVGKTTLANYLQGSLVKSARAVLYVPLQKAKIGDRYLAGLLSEAFPTVSKEQLFDSLFAGQIVILFDGYDEVSLTTWQIEMNKKFIHEIVEDFAAHAAKGLPAAPCLVFLFRSVFSETGIFDELAPYASHYRVEFFDRHQRRDYLRLYLESKGDGHQALVPHIDTVLAAFENRAEAATTQADAFFGHAIVLSAFGDFLMAQGEGNVYRLVRSLGAEGVSEAESVSILRGVIDTILEREVAKFPVLPSLQPLNPFPPFEKDLQELILRELAAKPATECGLDEFRSVIDQIGRQNLEASPQYAALAHEAQQVVAQDYLENLRGKVELHPFIDVRQKQLVFKNPIYQEYYLARYAASRPDLPLSSVITGGAPSYFLALFLLALVKDRDLTPYREGTFYVLQLLSAACNGDEYQIHIDYDTATGDWSAKVESANLRAAPFRVGRDHLFTLELPPNAVFQNFSVDGEKGGMVSVRGPAGYERAEPVLLSHGVITGEEVELDASAIKFDTVTLNTIALSLTDRVVELYGLDALTLTAERAPQLRASAYAQSRWSKSLTAVREGTSTIAEFQSKLKKILLWFRKHGRAEYGVYRPRFHTCATNKGRDADASRITEFLFKQGILTDGTLIILNQHKLAQYGVYYVKQNELKFETSFGRLFRDWQEFSRQDV